MSETSGCISLIQDFFTRANAADAIALKASDIGNVARRLLAYTLSLRVLDTTGFRFSHRAMHEGEQASRKMCHRTEAAG